MSKGVVHDAVCTQTGVTVNVARGQKVTQATVARDAVCFVYEAGGTQTAVGEIPPAG